MLHDVEYVMLWHRPENGALLAYATIDEADGSLSLKLNALNGINVWEILDDDCVRKLDEYPSSIFVTFVDFFLPWIVPILPWLIELRIKH